MPAFRTPEEIASADILDAELHPDARLRYIQRRLQEEEGTRLSIDSIGYILKLNGDYGSEPEDEDGGR